MGPFLSPNSKLSQISHVTTQNIPQEHQNFDGDVFGSEFESIEVFLGNFRVNLWPFRDNLGPFLSRNSNLSQTSHVTAQNNHKRGKIPMEIVLEVTLKPLR